MALKSKAAPIVRFFLKLSNQYPLTGTKARELKEEREREKRKSLLQEAQVQQLSSEVSSSEDGEAAQCSNLRAIALIENETRRYKKPALALLNIKTNILFPRQESQALPLERTHQG